jgi:hypothetical protein
MKFENSRREKLYLYIIGAFLHNNTIFGDENGAQLVTKRNVYCTDYFSGGDIVICRSSLRMNPNIFVIGKCIHKLADSEIIIQDIFTEQECRYSNENFFKIHNLPSHFLLSDKDHKCYVRFKRACKTVNKYVFRVCGVNVNKSERCLEIMTSRRFEKKEYIHKISTTMLLREMIEYLKNAQESFKKVEEMKIETLKKGREDEHKK